MSAKRQAGRPTRSMPLRESQADTPPWLSERQGTVLITMKVIPRAGRDELIVDRASPRARLTAPPVDGAANEALVELLAARLGVPRRAISIVRGTTSRTKTVEIAGMRAADVLARIGML